MGERREFLFRNWLICCSVLCFLTITLGGASAVFAQDAKTAAKGDEFVLEEIVVTGSRIVRNNQESTSPIVTVDASLLDQSATGAIETQLNKLPQFAPTIHTPTYGGDIQPSSRNTPGEATVALRGIGANRTLVLINGRRGTPANGMGILDINTIPTAAIEYVEAISGGASSTYGADAMAGVLNFIMKDNFTGMEFDTQAGMTEQGDNFEFQASSVVGTDFADGRGNVMVSFSYNKREAAQWKDRDWYVDNWRDPSIAGTQFFMNNPGIQILNTPNVANYYFGLDTNATPNIDVVNSVLGLSGADAFSGLPNYNGKYYVAPNGQVFTGFTGDFAGGKGVTIRRKRRRRRRH